jgi:hypothetical protein
MGAMPGKLVYKCRMCGSVFCSGEAVEDLRISLHSASVHLDFESTKLSMDVQTKFGKPDLYIYHSCTNGRIGLADIVGGQQD